MSACFVPNKVRFNKWMISCLANGGENADNPVYVRDLKDKSILEFAFTDKKLRRSIKDSYKLKLATN
jgi:hypothetical protein